MRDASILLIAPHYRIDFKLLVQLKGMGRFGDALGVPKAPTGTVLVHHLDQIGVLSWAT